ncbi:Clathrin light chain [Armadillidium nasatum]|uniref:Clathrin light chain n=1 Tax=Armadillidium nasatum TaxID=96803 RepID=A0A5N5SN06_9CRUS|nr:Clathrin light chain [Armadillidium nasatum]
MDGFGDDFVPVEKPIEDDPAAEFLAREQNELAGLDDDLASKIAQPTELSNSVTPPVITNGAFESELFGDVPTDVQDGHNFDLFPEHANGKGFGSSNFIPFDSWDDDDEQNLNSFDKIGGSVGFDPLKSEGSDEKWANFIPHSVPGGAPSPIPVVREEPEKIRLWREQQEKRLEEKDVAEELSKEELREKAAKELEEWYKQHEEQVTKTRQANRSAEKELVADTTKMEPGTEWERIAKLCDFNPKTSKSSRDISRMRSIILQVKQNPPIKA